MNLLKNTIIKSILCATPIEFLKNHEKDEKYIKIVCFLLACYFTAGVLFVIFGILADIKIVFPMPILLIFCFIDLLIIGRIIEKRKAVYCKNTLSSLISGNK